MTSAKDNPFATDRILQIRYIPQDTTWEKLIAKLESMHYRGAIIGPEGSGKTTLIEDIKKYLTDQGLICRTIFITMDVSVSLNDINEILYGDPFDVLLIDGADHLNRYVWYRIKNRIFRFNRGLIITAHKPKMLPALIECTTTPAILHQIVAQLAPVYNIGDLLDNLYEKHNGNIRDALRELYDIAAED